MNMIRTAICVAVMGMLWSSAKAQYKKLVWSDEFDKPGLADTTKWNYDIGDGCPDICGWGNNELQYYTKANPENARVENGKLIITAKKEAIGSKQFTSARLASKNKGDWKYGRMEIRAKLPTGTGIWPAIWMLPTKWQYGGWPHSGEIDIMEMVGYYPDSLFGTVHTLSYNGMIGTQKTKSIHVKDLSTAFHNYAITWNEKSISFFIDDIKYNEFFNDGKGSAGWPFDQDFHLLLNVAVGGNWGGKFGVDEKIFPQSMEVEYVRVYQ